MRSSMSSSARVAVALLTLSACSPREAPYASLPYVQDVSMTAATIAMVTEEPVRLRVELAPPKGAAPLVLEEAAEVTIHGLRFEALSADVLYRYRVRDAATGTELGGGTVRTAPLPGARPVKVACLGDSGRTKREIGGRLGAVGGLVDRLANVKAPGRQGRVATQIVAEAPDLALHLGDVVYPTGDRSQYGDGYFRPLARLIDHVPVFPAIGNHDLKTEDGAPWREVFHTPANNPEGDEAYYSFEFGPVHFVCIDTFSDGATTEGSPQLRWLMDDLSRRTAPWTVVYTHSPFFSDGLKGDDFHPGVRAVLEAFGVDLVLSGHEHNYQRFYPVRGVTYVVTGGGGNSTYPLARSERTAYAESVFHFVLLTIDTHTLGIEAIDATGARFDAAVLQKDETIVRR